MSLIAHQSSTLSLQCFCGINTHPYHSSKDHLSFLSISSAHFMDYIWDPPEGEALKINVHCITTAEPLRNGNSNSVGVIIRNKAGEEVWSAAGPMPGKSKLQATLWGIYHGALQCNLLKKWETHIETDHWGALEAISFQEEIPQQEDVHEVIRLINTLHSNNYQIGTTDRVITRIPIVRNGMAAYLARYGLENMRQFAETPGSFGEKKFMLDRDMGLLFDAHPPANFGLGEVIDGEAPQENSGTLLLDQSQPENVSILRSLISLPGRLGKAVAKWMF